MKFHEVLELANSQRKKGEHQIADNLLNLLLEHAPDSEELLFYKALNYHTWKPDEAMKLYDRIIENNPNLEPARNNVIFLARETKDYETATAIFDKALLKDPHNPELVCQRALLIHDGNYCKALIDLYSLIQKANLQNSTDFIKHPVTTEIARCKVEIRNQTLRSDSGTVALKQMLDIPMKEYHYPIPHKLFGDENFFFEFGKYMGRTVAEVMEVEPSYLMWCISNLDNFCVSEEIIELLKLQGIHSKEMEMINSLKLKMVEEQKPKLYFDGESPEVI